MIHYAGLDNKYGIETLKKQLIELEKDARRPFSNFQLIPLLEIANTKNYEAVKMMVRTLPTDATAEDMGALLEDIEKEIQGRIVINKLREELKQSEVKRLRMEEEEKQLKLK
jgi:hypothetical protein